MTTDLKLYFQPEGARNKTACVVGSFLTALYNPPAQTHPCGHCLPHPTGKPWAPGLRCHLLAGEDLEQGCLC
jgi:hypothetical protein